jgi:hypothetical protein
MALGTHEPSASSSASGMLLTCHHTTACPQGHTASGTPSLEGCWRCVQLALPTNNQGTLAWPPSAAVPPLGHCSNTTPWGSGIPSGPPCRSPRCTYRRQSNMKKRAAAQTSTIVRTQLCSASLLEVPTDNSHTTNARENCVEAAHTQQAAAADAAVQQEGRTHATASGVLAGMLHCCGLLLLWYAPRERGPNCPSRCQACLLPV